MVFSQKLPLLAFFRAIWQIGRTILKFRQHYFVDKNAKNIFHALKSFHPKYYVIIIAGSKKNSILKVSRMEPFWKNYVQMKLLNRRYFHDSRGVRSWRRAKLEEAKQIVVLINCSTYLNSFWRTPQQHAFWRLWCSKTQPLFGRVWCTFTIMQGDEKRINKNSICLKLGFTQNSVCHIKFFFLLSRTSQFFDSKERQ